jgi:Flp pilus assembly pilin Flp
MSIPIRIFLKDPSYLERGASLVEYGIVVALISVLALAGVRSLGNSVAHNADCVSLNLSGIPCTNAGLEGDD